MNPIIELIKQKNTFLNKFYTINKSQILKLSESDFLSLDDFYQTRERILEIINHLDQNVEELTNNLDKNFLPTATQKTELRTLLQHKDEVVSKIIDQDLQILSLIELAKNQLIKDLQDVQKSRKLANTYHSGNTKQSIDEEV